MRRDLLLLSEMIDATERELSVSTVEPWRYQAPHRPIFSAIEPWRRDAITGAWSSTVGKTRNVEPSVSHRTPRHFRW